MALSVSDFAKKIKNKYPEYKDVDDLELAKKIVEKYPEYKSRVMFDDSVKKKDQSELSPYIAKPTSIVSKEVPKPLQESGTTTNSQVDAIDNYIANADGKLPTDGGFMANVGTTLSNEKISKPRQDLIEVTQEQKDLEEAEKLKRIDKDKKRVYTALDYLSSDKEASKKKLYSMDDDELQSVKDDLIDRLKLSPDAIDEAIAERKQQFKKERDVLIVNDYKKKTKEDLINKAINKSVDLEKYEPQIFRRDAKPDITQPLGFTPKKTTILSKLNEEDKKKVIQEAEKEYNANIDIKAYSLLSEDDKILAKNNAEFQSVSEQLKDALSNKDGIDEKKSIELKEKLVELEMQRKELGARERLYNPFTGQTIDRDKATPEIVEFNNTVQQMKKSLTDKDITKKVLEDNLIKLEYFQNKLDEKIPNYQNITYRDLLNPATTMKYQFIDEATEKEAFKLRDEFLDAGAKAQALSSAIYTNQDPAAIKRGLFKESGGSDAFGRGLSDAIGLRNRLTDLDEAEIATKFTEAMQEVEENNVLTKAQIENAKETFGEKLTYGAGASLPVMAEIMASTMLLESGAGALGVARGLVKMRGLIETIVKSKKASNLFTNIIKEGAKGVITFAPTSETGLTGSVEGVTQALLPQNMFKGNKYGKLMELGTRILAGTATETPAELAGMYVQSASDNGWDMEAAFDRTFGRTPKEIWETLAMTTATSAMMSGAFNSPILLSSKKGLEQEVAKGNVPKEDLEAVQEIITLADEKLRSDNPKVVTIKSEGKESIVPTEDFEATLQDEAFIEKVANGEVEVTIDNDTELGNRLNEKVEAFKTEQEITKAFEDDSENEAGLQSDEQGQEAIVEEQSLTTPKGNTSNVGIEAGSVGVGGDVGQSSTDVDNIKRQQLEIINQTNPAPNDYNTWIRKVEDIKTAEEAFAAAQEDGAMYPDFTEAQMQEALGSGEIIVYSSMPIKNGVFVSPSKMNAQEYAGGKGGKLYSKKVKLDDVAWIDEGEGQYAQVKAVEQYLPTQEVKDNTEQIETTKTKIEKADERLKKAKEDFRKSGGLSTGGLQNLEQFVNLIAAYINKGVVEVQDLIGRIRKDFPNESFNPKIVNDALDIINANKNLTIEVAKGNKVSDGLKTVFNDYQTNGGTLSYNEFLKGLKSYISEQKKIKEQAKVEEGKAETETILESKPKTKEDKIKKVALKLGLKTQQDLNKEVADLIKEYMVKGLLNDRQVKALTKRALGVKVGNLKSQTDFANFFNKLMDDVEYVNKRTEARAIISKDKIKKVALKLGLKTQQDLNKEVADLIKEYMVKGLLNDRQVKALTKRALGVKVGNLKSQTDFANFFNKVMDDVEYVNKRTEARAIISKAKKQAKSKTAFENTENLANKIASIDINYIENIDGLLDVLREYNDDKKVPNVAKLTNDINPFVEESMLGKEEALRQKTFEIAEGLGYGKAALKGLTYAEIKKLLETPTGLEETLSSEEKLQEKKAAMVEANSILRDFLKGLDTTELSAKEKGLLKDLINVDLSELNLGELKSLFLVGNNILTNQSFANAENLAITFKSKHDAKVFLKQVKNSKIMLSKAWLNPFRSFQQLIDNIFMKNRVLAAKFTDLIGELNANEGRKIVKDKTDIFIERFNKILNDNKLNTLADRARITTAALGLRYDGYHNMTEEEEFQGNKADINANYENTKNDADFKDELQEAKEAADFINQFKTKKDLEDFLNKKENKGMKDALTFIEKSFAKIAQERVDLSSTMFNSGMKLVDKHYAPKKVITRDKNDADSVNPFEQKYTQISLTPKRAGSAIDANKPGSLGNNRLGLDLLVYGSYEMEKALTEIHLSKATLKAKTILKSKDVQDVLGISTTRLLEEKIKNQYAPQIERSQSSAKLNSVIDFIRKSTTASILSGFSQLIKQSSVIANISSTLPPKQALLFSKELATGLKNFKVATLITPTITKQLVNPIHKMFAIGSRVEMNIGVDRGETARKARKNLLGKQLGFIRMTGKYLGKGHDVITDLLLSPMHVQDIYISTATWNAAYKGYLAENGITDVDMATEHEKIVGDNNEAQIRREAAAYAEHMVGITQIPSDAAQRAEIMKDGNMSSKLLRIITTPFNNFGINSLVRKVDAVKGLFNKEGKVQSAKDLVGLVAEAAAFQYTKYALAIHVFPKLASITYAALTGEDEDDVDELVKVDKEYAEKVIDRSLDALYVDLVLQGTPEAAKELTVSLLNAINYNFKKENGLIDDSISFSDWQKEGGGLSQFKKDDDYLIQSYGLLGIMPTKLSNSYTSTKLITEGIVEGFMGKDKKVKLADKDKRVMQVIEVIEYLNAIGLSGADLSNISSKIKKGILDKHKGKKGAKKKVIKPIS